MNKNELLLKTAFCCMACDGKIASSEISKIKEFISANEEFKGLNSQQQLLDDYVSAINQNGKAFLSSYLDEVGAADLKEKDELSIVKVAIEMIEADNEIEYSEISFFKRIRTQLKLSDETIVNAFPNNENIEDYLLPDITVPKELDYCFNFEMISVN